eukprot:SAG11_NODE_1222_length_5484_cov_7.843268_3_plen_198_part_00
MLAGRVGAKAVLTWSSWFSCAMLLLLPVAVARSTRLGALCLLGVGAAQAPLRPAQVLLTYNWLMHSGASRAYYMMVISLGSALAKFVAAAAIPLLCGTRGWRAAIAAMVTAFGGFNFLWQLLITELPDLQHGGPGPARLATTVVGPRGSEQGAEVEAEAVVGAGCDMEAGGREREPTIREMFFAPPFQTSTSTTVPT